MIYLAFRNLVQNRLRLAMSVTGVGLAMLLILSLDAILTGSERQVTAYIDYSGSDVIVSQSGVRNMHTAASSLPASVEPAIQAVEGVRATTPILYLTNMVSTREERNLAYIIGVPDSATIGGAWEVAEGAWKPGAGETIIDRGVAARSGVDLGDDVEILGQSFTVVGLSEGTASIVNSVAFIPFEDFAELVGSRGTVSYVLVNLEAGASPTEVAARIERDVAGVTAQPREVFSDQERRIVRDMSTDLMVIMNLVGLLIGLAVMALTVYTATRSRLAEYGILKAIGAKSGHLYRLVVSQALLSVAIGFGLGLVLTLLLSVLVPRIESSLILVLSLSSLNKVAGLALLLAALASGLPIWQIRKLDPAAVFRRR